MSPALMRYRKVEFVSNILYILHCRPSGTTLLPISACLHCRLQLSEWSFLFHTSFFRKETCGTSLGTSIFHAVTHDSSALASDPRL